MSTVLGQERFEQLDQLTFQQSPTSADYSITFYAGHWASQGYRVIVIGEIGLTCTLHLLGWIHSLQHAIMCWLGHLCMLWL